MRLAYGCLRHLVSVCVIGLCFIGLPGCDSGDSGKSQANTSHDHDKNGDDHDHGDHADHDHDHDHADHIDAKSAGLNADELPSLDEPPIPDNLNDAVAALGKVSKAISDGFEAGKVDDAHGPLHDVANLLEGIESLAAESDLSDEAKKSVADAIKKLFQAYGDVDLKLHNAEKGKDYADVSDTIAAALKTLQDSVK